MQGNNDAQNAFNQGLAPGNVTRMKSDKEIADELRGELRPLLETLCKLMDQATKQQMLVSWAIGVNAYGQRFIQDLSVVKLL